MKNKECAVIRKQQTKTNKKKGGGKRDQGGSKQAKLGYASGNNKTKEKQPKETKLKGETEREGEGGRERGERAAKCIVAWK